MRFLLTIAVGLLVAAQPTAADSVDAELTALLHDFLANVDTHAAHERLWASDLIYTSSSGLRFGKATIMESYTGEEPAPASVRYSAEDIRVQVYGDAAIVAFKLVAEPVGGSSDGSAASSADASEDEQVRYFLNTGTFVKRDGRWQAVAWQATQAAEPAEP